MTRLRRAIHPNQPDPAKSTDIAGQTEQQKTLPSTWEALQ